MGATKQCPFQTKLQATAEKLLASPEVTEQRLQQGPPLDDIQDSDAAAMYFDNEPDLVFTINSEIDYPRAIIFVQEEVARVEELRKEGTKEVIAVKAFVDERPVSVTVKIGTRGGRSEEVHFGPGGSYPALAEKIKAFQDGEPPLKDQDVAADILRAFQQEEITNGDDNYKDFVSRMTFLLFGTEAARNPATLLTAPMMLSLIRDNGMSFDDFFNNPKFDEKMGGGLFPMSFKGAVPGARTVREDSKVQYVGPKGTEKQAAELVARESALVKLWAEKNGIPKKPPSELEGAIEGLADQIYKS